MKNFELGPLFHEYAALVIPKLHSDEISLVHQDYSQFLIGRIQEMKEWQIALPVIACLCRRWIPRGWGDDSLSLGPYPFSRECLFDDS